MIYFGLDNLLTYGLLILAFIVVVAAQAKITSAYNKFKRVKSKGNLSGQEVARRILDEN